MPLYEGALTLDQADTFHPWVAFQVLSGPRSISAEVLERNLVQFEYIDEPKKFPHVEAHFDNASGEILNMAVLLLGLKLRVTFGYDQLRSRPFDIVLRKIKGVGVRSPTSVSPAPEGAGLVVMDFGCHEASGLRMHLDATKSPKVYRGMSAGEVAAQIARGYGFKERKIFVEYADSRGRPLRKIPIVETLVDETDAHLLDRLAAEIGYVWFTRGGEFHFHTRGYKKAPVEHVEYFRGQELLEFSFDGDYTINPSKVRVTSFNPLLARTTVVNEDTGQMGVAIPAQASTQRELVTIRDSVTSTAGKETQKGTTRLHNLVHRRWRIPLTIVGNPKIFRGTHLVLSNFGPFVDGPWYVEGARHLFDQQGYTTKLGLRGIPQAAKNAGPIVYTVVVDPDTGVMGVAQLHAGSVRSILDRKKKGRKKKGDTSYKGSSTAPLEPTSRKTRRGSATGVDPAFNRGSR